jgi:hypothetical protein
MQGVVSAVFVSMADGRCNTKVMQEQQSYVLCNQRDQCKRSVEATVCET